MEDTAKKGIYKVKRRDFLKIGAVSTGGLLLGVPLSCNTRNQYLTGDAESVFSPGVYIQLLGTGEVSLYAHRSEMGTGIKTTLPLIIADELEADWDKVKVVQATGDYKYGDQNTDGSNSIQKHFDLLRKAGATARLMLIKAAALEWGVPVSECKAENHTVVHQSGKVFGYGYLADKASALEIPDDSEVSLKSVKDFNYISKKSSIYDLKDIVSGKAEFGIDVTIPGALIAVIARNPENGAGINSFNAEKALAVPGVVSVFQLETTDWAFGLEKALGGIAVVAQNTWAALKAKDLLEVDWKKGEHAAYDSEAYWEQQLQNTKRKGIAKRKEGDVEAAFKNASEIVEGFYQVPHYAHATMEPPCATVHCKTDGSIEVWAPVQSPQWARGAVARALSVDEEKVRVNVTLLGGGFGRKGKPDFVVEAALVSKKMNKPVKLIWTREDDIQHDFYHTISSQYIKVGIDENNKVTAWLHRALYPGIGWGPSQTMPSIGELCLGMLDMPFDIKNVLCETNDSAKHIRLGWLRSVSNIHQAFAINSMLDQVAEKRKTDPIENALELIGEDRNIDFASKVDGFSNYQTNPAEYPRSTKRLKDVIRKVRELSNWGEALSAGRFRGFAVHSSFLTYVACVVEIELDKYKNVKIPNVYYAVDCGIPVNPDRIKAQFEGGAVFGISLALKSEITVKNGQVVQSISMTMK
ncbi:molybdopterin cofactor-binding domain-containing protein [Draconibacterium sp. IB214405]|uniref:xanthine dehydrogenase family protein molybdopterin-binding subunit n=1 Tax=Draconibacterium sp. IB214405 TaxID=3097352 RepID=UPI002A165FE4|nr:molybdopterin cofactor-binding domain-containing protein [Draconibacterium sp. IB214405]MDX8340374.1 molybdopterin cofactor-binding domain-containing protein [Draconibacterium sp. IB214405]